MQGQVEFTGDKQKEMCVVYNRIRGLFILCKTWYVAVLCSKLRPLVLKRHIQEK